MKKIVSLFLIIALLLVNVAGDITTLMSNPWTEYKLLNKALTTEEFVRFASEQALDWSPEEMNKIQKIMGSIRTRLDKFSLVFPDRINIVKATGKEEGNTAYIIHPEETLADNFVLLVNQETNIQSPKIISWMQSILA